MTIWLVITAAALAQPTHWAGFRGDGSSHATFEKLPLQWSDNEHVAWQRALTGYGQSSPVVWDQSVYVTSVVGKKKEQIVAASFDLRSGKSNWEVTLDAAQQIADSDYVSKAAPTPVVDAKRLYSFFESGDLVAFDHDGAKVWHRKLTQEYGEFKGNHGVGSSLAAAADTIFVLVDHDGPSYLLAVDKQSGQNRWKLDRPAKVSWSSPIVAGDGATAELIVSSNGSVESFSAADGKSRWQLTGLKGNTVPSAVVGKELVVVGSSEPGNNLAVPRNGAGELADNQVLWKAKDATCSLGSPLLYDGCVYMVNRAGVAFCLDAKTGQTHWSERLGGSCWASPLASGDRIYFFGKDGLTTVLRSGPQKDKLAENQLAIEGRVYGVAATPGAFVLRTGQKLICVGNP